MIALPFTLAGLEPRDAVGANLAAAAAGVLAAVLLWHAVSMARQGRWAEWTCWSAGCLAVITGVWVIMLLIGAAGQPRQPGQSFDNPWTKLAVLTLLAIATAIIFYHAVYHYLGPARILLLLVLRCLAIVVLVVLLFKPTLVARPGLHDRPALVVLIDRSQSMSEADVVPDLASANRKAPRLDAVIAALTAERSRLESFFDVTYYAFDKSAELVEGSQGNAGSQGRQSSDGGQAPGLAELRPTGEGTFIDAALATVSPLLDESRFKGAILLSDGAHNGPGSALDAAQLLKKPLVTVCVGGPVSGGNVGRDVEIAQVLAPDQAVCRNIAEVKFDVNSVGFAGRLATAVLRQAGVTAGGATGAGGPATGAAAEELARTTVDLTDATVPVKLEFTPRQIGVMDLELFVGQVEPSGRGPSTGPDGSDKIVPLDGEMVAGNNRHTFSVRVGQPRIRVLYVEGRLRPEFRHLVQTLGSDPQLELLTLAEVAPPGTALNPSSAVKFAVSGSVGGKQIAGLPTAAEQFKLFDVIIIGDLDRTFLSDSQMKLMQDWVKDGKGLLMFGGSHSFGPGGYGGTPMEQILPVELGPRTIGQETTPFRLQLTEQGRIHPIFSGLADLISPPPNGPPSHLPELTGCVKVLRAKPAGQVLAVHPTRQTPGAVNPSGESPLPVLTVQGYGSGRSAAFTADTTWNWIMFRTVAAYEGVHQRFWGQLVRWLASSELVDRQQPAAAVLNLPRSHFTPNEPLPLVARVWDKDGLPADGCRVTVRVTTPGRQQAGTGRRGPVEIDLPVVREQAGLYQTTLPPQPPGMLQLTLSASKAGNLLGTCQRKVEVGLPGAEAVSRSANPDLMRALADARPGLAQPSSLPLSNFSRMVDQLVAQFQRSPSAGPERIWPNYDNVFQGLAMLAFIVLLSMEWLLRRRWQLQ